MTLATHAVAGALLGALLPHDPALAFTLGFASHFAFDTIPHWDYHLASLSMNEGDSLSMSMGKGPAFISDLFRTGGDLLIGVAVSLLVLHFGLDVSLRAPLAWPIFFGMAGAVFPDFLQFVYMKWKHEPLLSLQRFHGWIHSKIHIHDATAGILLQSAFVAFLFGVFILVR